MKKIYRLLVVLLFAMAIIGCDYDECPKCHECECICTSYYHDYDECPVCHECECIC
jgi:hypothetical protein